MSDSFQPDKADEKTRSKMAEHGDVLKQTGLPESNARHPTAKPDSANVTKKSKLVSKSGSSPQVSTVSKPTRRLRAVQPDTPNYLIPKMGELPVAEAVRFVTVHMTDRTGSAEPKLFEGRLKISKKCSNADIPAIGVRLIHEQNWFTRGLALGNLLHSVALAPGEVTQIAVDDWRRREKGQAAEATTQTDNTSETDKRDRALDEIQNSAASEVQKGSSIAASVGASAQSGIFASMVAAGSVNASLATNTNFSSSRRDLAMNENQRINEATHRAARASRDRRASVVRETNQGESENLSTRVLANYNHAHALTVMYFDVVEVYELITKVIAAERLIYLPMEFEDLTLEHVCLFGEQMAMGAEARGDMALAAELRAFRPDEGETDPAFSLVKATEITRTKTLVPLPEGSDRFNLDANGEDDFIMRTGKITPPPGSYSLGDIVVRAANDLEKIDDGTLNSPFHAFRPIEKNAVARPVDYELVGTWKDKKSRFQGSRVSLASGASSGVRRARPYSGSP